jgi:hypothetical protein
MAMPTRTRWLILGSLLTATLAAMVWVNEQSEPTALTVAEPRKSQGGVQLAQAPASRLSLEKLQRRAGADAEQMQDVFKAKSWYVPPPPPKPTPPPPPAPPPLPFKYLGKLLDDGKLTVFISNQDKNYAVKAGDTLEGAYRVDSVEAQRVLFTYLPLNMQQTLVIGGVN